MFQNSKVSVILRIVCLITFIAVISFVNSFVTLALLTIVFYLFTRNEKDSIVFLWHIITIIVFLFSCYINSYYLLKIVLVIGLSYYFLVIPYDWIPKINNKLIIILDKYFIRFKNNRITRKDGINKNLVNTIYITVHLVILFIAIMVG